MAQDTDALSRFLQAAIVKAREFGEEKVERWLQALYDAPPPEPGGLAKRFASVLAVTEPIESDPEPFDGKCPSCLVAYEPIADRPYCNRCTKRIAAAGRKLRVKATADLIDATREMKEIANARNASRRPTPRR